MEIIGKFSDDIFNDLSGILSSLRYKTVTDDKKFLELIFMQNLQSFKNKLNRDDIPMELYYPLLHRTAGEFLNLKLATESLEIENLDLGPIASTITRGKVTIKLEGASPKETFEKVIRLMLNSGEKEMLRFRKFRW